LQQSASSPIIGPTLVTAQQPQEWPPILALTGFVLIVVLNARKILGATLIGILAVTLAGLALGIVHYGGVVSMPPSLAPTFLQLDFSRVFEHTAVFVIVTLLFVDLFDTAGTLIGVSYRAGFLDDEGKLPRMGRALVADSAATTVGALLGTSNTTSYIESTAGRRSRRPHRLDRGVRGDVFLARAVLCAARRHDPKIRLRRRAALCRLRDDAGARRPRLG
jgi:xanthine/uracil/vitamin C permease (AzgA family)